MVSSTLIELVDRTIGSRGDMMAKDVRERMEEVGMMCTLDMANVVDMGNVVDMYAEGRSRNRVTPIATAPPLKMVEQLKHVNRAELVSN